MKTLFNYVFTLIKGLFSLFSRQHPTDGAAISQKTPSKPNAMFQHFAPDMDNKPTKPARKIKKHNNRKRTRGRRFYYDAKGRRHTIERG